MTTEAALKAWKTRRKAAKSRKTGKTTRERLLSERALKAWETRRANGWVHPNSQPKPKVRRRAA